MNPKPLLKQVEFANHSLFAVNIAGLVLVFLGLALNARYLNNYFNGPFAVESSELEKITSKDEPEKYFLTVTGAKTIDSGYQNVMSSRNKYTQQTTETGRSTYYLLLFENRIRDVLIVKASADVDKTTYTGYLEEIPAELRNAIQRDLNYSADKFSAQFHPLMLTADRNFRITGHLGLGVAIALCGLVVWNLWKWNSRRADLLRHPGCKSLSNYGAVNDVVAGIDAEVRKGVKSFGHLHVTHTWIIQKFLTQFRIINVQDCDWVYLKTTQHSYWFIPTGKVFAVIIKTRDEPDIEATMKEPLAIELLKELAAKAPWAITGYSDKLDEAWKNQREFFHANIDERKSEWLKTQS